MVSMCVASVSSKSGNNWRSNSFLTSSVFFQVVGQEYAIDIMCLNTDVDRLISKRVLEFPMTFFLQVFHKDLKKTKEDGRPSDACFRDDYL